MPVGHRGLVRCADEVLLRTIDLRAWSSRVDRPGLEPARLVPPPYLRTNSMTRRICSALCFALSVTTLGLAAQARAAEPVMAGALRIETPWMRATPGGAKVAGGYVRVTNTGTQADRLTGAAIATAGRGAIHSMTMAGSVMKMAPVPEGLPIGPGQTIELKPGGLHLMFEDLKAEPKVGEPVSGTLSFERAGTVPVTFAVAPIGATSPNAAGPAAPAPHHHH